MNPTEQKERHRVTDELRSEITTLAETFDGIVGRLEADDLKIAETLIHRIDEMLTQQTTLWREWRKEWYTFGAEYFSYTTKQNGRIGDLELLQMTRPRQTFWQRLYWLFTGRW